MEKDKKIFSKTDTKALKSMVESAVKKELPNTTAQKLRNLLFQENNDVIEEFLE